MYSKYAFAITVFMEKTQEQHRDRDYMHNNTGATSKLWQGYSKSTAHKNYAQRTPRREESTSIQLIWKYAEKAQHRHIKAIKYSMLLYFFSIRLFLNQIYSTGLQRWNIYLACPCVAAFHYLFMSAQNGSRLPWTTSWWWGGWGTSRWARSHCVFEK